MIKQLILAFIGFASGIGIAGGVFAFILSIGVVNRLAAVTHTARHIMLYETSILLGALFGNILSIHNIALPLGISAEIVFGIFAGIFAGCLAIALAEVLRVIPILLRRVSIKKGVGWVIMSIALGKTVGSLLQFYMGWTK